MPKPNVRSDFGICTLYEYFTRQYQTADISGGVFFDVTVFKVGREIPVAGIPTGNIGNYLGNTPKMEHTGKCWVIL